MCADVSVCVYVYVYVKLFVVCVCFVLCMCVFAIDSRAVLNVFPIEPSVLRKFGESVRAQRRAKCDIVSDLLSAS